MQMYGSTHSSIKTLTLQVSFDLDVLLNNVTTPDLLGVMPIWPFFLRPTHISPQGLRANYLAVKK